MGQEQKEDQRGFYGNLGYWTRVIEETKRRGEIQDVCFTDKSLQDLLTD